jgi:hypothetical protein
MSHDGHETPIIRGILALKVEETGNPGLPQIVRVRCETAVGELTIVMSPTAAGYLGKALGEHRVTKGFA